MQKIIVILVITAGVIALYVVTLVCVLRPKVSAEYREYYIDKVLSDWKPARYAGTPEEGITFSTPGLPTFIRSMYGFARRCRGAGCGPEPWGRWTDAKYSPRAADGTPVARILLSEPLEGPICVELRARMADWPMAKTISVNLGKEQHAVVFHSADFSDQLVDFVAHEAVDTIEFRPSGIVGYRKILGARIENEPRGALGIASLRLFHSDCETVRRGAASTHF